MNRIPNRGSWIVAAALLVAVALSAVGVYAWRERGAWLRVPPGRFYVCIQVVDPNPTDVDMTVLSINLLSYWVEGEHAWAPGASRSERATAFRPAYFQHALAKGDPAAMFLGLQRKLSLGLPKCLMALVNDRGDVVRLEPWPPAPGF